jgi:hypothetical protein
VLVTTIIGFLTVFEVRANAPDLPERHSPSPWPRAGASSRSSSWPWRPSPFSACADLLADTTLTDDEGVTRPLIEPDILVVAPYNLAARGLLRDDLLRQRGRASRRRLPSRRTPLQPRDLPRAVPRRSRPQPEVLDTDCNSLETMALVDGACRYLELAT